MSKKNHDKEPVLLDEQDTVQLAATRSSPLYQQVKRYILKRVESGAWPEGHRLPSESQFARNFGLSRLTVHRAIRELFEDGVVVRTPGVGTFVASSRPQSTVLEVRNIADEIRERGHDHDAKVHLLCSERIDQRLADAFNLPLGAEIFHSIVVHCENSVPVQLEDRFVNPSFAPGYVDQDLTKITPNEFLAHFGQPDEVEHIFESVMPDVQIRRYLGMKKNESCLLLHRRTWVGGLIATKVELYHPGSRYRVGGKFKPRHELRRR